MKNRPAILDQITEAQVSEWMLARLAEIRETDHNVSCITLDVHFYSHSKETSFSVTMHGDRQCVTNHPDTAAAYKDLAAILYGDPIRRAAKLRQEADEAIAKANELEQRAKNPPF